MFFAIVAIIHFSMFVFGIYFFVIVAKKSDYKKQNYINFFWYFLLYLIVNLVVTHGLSYITNNAKIGSIAYAAFPFMILLLSVISYAANEIFALKGKFLSMMFAIIISTPVTLLINLVLHDYLLELSRGL